MALNKLELTTPSLMSSELDDYTDLLACSSVEYEARDSTPGVKFKTQSVCEGWTPVTQPRRRPEHGDGSKANLKIPDYSGSELSVNFAREVFYRELNSQPGLLFVMEKLTTVTTGSPSPQAQLHHAPEQRSE